METRHTRPVYRGALPTRRCAAALLVLAACSGSPEQPDVVLITVDTLRADHLGAYGYVRAHTPHLDRLAEQGRRFTQATTPFPRTTPAMASMLTALSPGRHGSREVGQRMRKDVPLLQEVLSTRGWTTLGVSSNLAAGSRQGLHRGFDRFVDRDALPDHRAAHVTDRALALVAQVSASRPLLLWVHYSDPHFPYDPPDSLPKPTDAPACRSLQQALERREIPRGRVVSNWDGAAGRALADCIALYDAEIAYTDHEIGRLLDGLRDAGRLERALVVFTSDHGENLGEADLYYEHGPSVHDASLRVPLIFAGPGIEPGLDAEVASLEDVAPTLLDWLGVPREGWTNVDGRSLAPRLRGETHADPERVAFAEAGHAFHRQDFRRFLSGMARNRCLNGERYSLCQTDGRGFGLYDPRADPGLTHDLTEEQPEVRDELLRAWLAWRGRDPRERSVRTPRFKLVERPGLLGWERSLYDLASDPDEMRDASADHPQVVERLAAELEGWASTLPGAPRIRERELELLRRLGYAE